MIVQALRRLADLGVAVSESKLDVRALRKTLGEASSRQLEPLLTMKNGLYAFGGALHVFSAAGTTSEPGLVQWNDPALWRKDYDGLADGAVFFAEDVFGGQFCVLEGVIAAFDPETGEFETIANDLEAWARLILRDYRVLTGSPLAHDWQASHGALRAGQRLLPVQPFVMGGDFEVANLRAHDAVKGMRHRARVALQMRDMPDGAALELRVFE